jgi:hypothetical protein
MGTRSTVTDGPDTTERVAYRAARVVARSYVAALVVISFVAVLSTALGSQASIVKPGALMVSSGFEIPFAGLPALWLTEDQQWFTAWVIVTMVASMLSIPRSIRARVGSNAEGSEEPDGEQRPGANRRLVAVSAGPLLLVLAATLPLA